MIIKIQREQLVNTGQSIKFHVARGKTVLFFYIFPYILVFFLMYLFYGKG